ncbi:MAG TPA: hypothetical protein VMG30_07965 [Acidobacteriota bacterium]|nr:hypothetical protein [Acidobacteriota bacterium]
MNLPQPHIVQRPALFKVLLLALVAAAFSTTIAVKSANLPGAHPASIIFPGAEGPSARVFLEDFPNAKLPAGIGHDGQQFYAIARQPLHLNRVAPDLDRPRYRLQRIAFPLIVWMLHPQGGGKGLVTATIVVGALSLFAGGAAAGLLSLKLGGPAWPALVFALLPGAILTMRISAADNLALAAGLAAIAFSIGKRQRWALAAGILATLAKESTWLVLLGLALWRRDRQGFALAGIPALIAGAWWLALRLLVSDNRGNITEFTLPLLGLRDSVRYWMTGSTVFAYYLVPLALGLGAWALIRVRMRHPLGPAILLQFILLALVNLDVLGPDANGSRVTMPVFMLGTIALASHLSKKRQENQASS